jgi:hypothetical protein
MLVYIVMNEHRLIIPQPISRIALYSTPCIIQCMCVSYWNEYTFLTIGLSCLFASSILYWNDIQNKAIYNIDRTLAVSVLSIKSYIAYNNFNMIGEKIWYTSLFVSAIAYISSSYLFQINKNGPETEKETIMKRSVYYHMFFIHFLPTTTFSVCVLYYLPRIDEN